MSGLFRRLVLVSLSLLCLTAFATSAAAECAWIVWEQMTGSGLSPAFVLKAWRPVASYDEKQGCDAAARRGNVAQQKGENPRAFYVCLPDNVDPRGPKEK